MNHPPPSSPPTLVLTDAADTLAVIPYVIGYHPASDVVIVGLRDNRYHAALRYDLWPLGSPCPITSGVLAATGIDTALIAAYGPRRQASTCLAETFKTTAMAGIRAEQLIVVHDGAFVDFCSSPRTPMPLPTATSTLSAGLTAAGYGAFPDRATFIAHLDPIRGAFTTAVSAAVTTHQRWNTDPQSPVADFLAAYLNTQVLPDVETTARLLLAVTDPEVPVPVLEASTPDRLTSLIPLWTHLVRHAPKRLRAVPAAFLAYTARRAGNTGLARLAIDHALASDPSHPVVAMIADKLNTSIPAFGNREATS